MFASVSDMLPAIVGVGSEVLGGDGEDIGKLIGKRQAHLNRGLSADRSLTISR